MGFNSVFKGLMCVSRAVSLWRICRQTCSTISVACSRQDTRMKGFFDIDEIKDRTLLGESTDCRERRGVVVWIGLKWNDIAWILFSVMEQRGGDTRERCGGIQMHVQLLKSSLCVISFVVEIGLSLMSNYDWRKWWILELNPAFWLNENIFLSS